MVIGPGGKNINTIREATETEITIEEDGTVFITGKNGGAETAKKMIEEKDHKEKESNRLFPVFLKLETLSLLIIGGGPVALEKLRAVLSNAPATKIRIIALTIMEELVVEAAHHPGTIELVQKQYEAADLTQADLGAAHRGEGPGVGPAAAMEHRQRPEIDAVEAEPEH